MKEQVTKTTGVILATATLVAGGMYTITSEDKQALEEQIATLEANKTFSVENVVDKSGTLVFESHGMVTKVVIDGVEYLPK